MSDPRKRLHTLLTDRAIAGLDPREREELELLLAGGAIDPSYEHAAAAIELALLDHTEAMPAGLEASIAEQAGRYWGFTELNPREPTLGGSAGGEVMLGGRGGTDEHAVLESSGQGRVDQLGLDDDEPAAGESGRTAILRATHDFEDDDDDFDLDDDDDDADDSLAGASPTTAQAELDDARGPGPRKRRRRSDLDPAASTGGDSLAGPVVPISRDYRVARWATYVSALAALVMLAIALWLFARRNEGPSADELQASVDGADDKVQWQFAVKPDEAVGADAGGSVSWSSELQAGVMVIHGLAANDPTVAQYQLWIVDRNRDGPPVDGGVFDVRAEDLDEGSGEVQIPINAKLLVSDPAAFVITVERPGGVVVSGQERVAMVAAP